MSVTFTKATKVQAKLRLALEAPAGFGKTFTALTVGRELVGPTGRIALLDTEHGSAAKYAHLFDFDHAVAEPPFHPRMVVDAIASAEEAGYDLFIVDSLSHFWEGTGGLLDIVDQIARTKYRGDSHRAWKDGGEIEQEMKDAILRSRVHVIAAMRTKTDHVREEYSDSDGAKRTRIRKAGTKTVQREGLDYEFDLVGRFDVATVLTVTKTRVDTLPPETIVDKPGKEFADTLNAWLSAGIALPPKATAADQKKLTGLVKQLAEADDTRNWQEIVEKYAKREFGHGIAALTKPEIAQSMEQLQTFLSTLPSANGAQAETVPA